MGRELQIWLLVFCMFVPQAYSDRLILKQKEGGNEVEVLEEREDSFIIKVPKDEIVIIKRERPSEIELWKQKKILWEDSGDYITIYLPKERVVLPQGYRQDEYDSARALREALSSAGQEGRPEEISSFKVVGNISGRIVNRGNPVAGAKIKIVNVSYQEGALARIFAPQDIKPENLVFETQSDQDGNFRFKSVPIGEYDVYWSPAGSDGWYRKLSPKPDITLRPGETVNYPDIEIEKWGF